MASAPSREVFQSLQEKMGDFDELLEHDQLPNVEEYKVQVGFKSSGTGRRPDPLGIQSSRLLGTSYNTDDPEQSITFVPENNTHKVSVFDEAQYTPDLSTLENQESRNDDNDFTREADGYGDRTDNHGILSSNKNNRKKRKKRKTKISEEEAEIERREYDKMLEREDRHWVYCFAFGVCLIIIALVVGVPIGLKRRNSSSSDGPYPWIKSSKRFNDILDYLLEFAVSTADDLHDTSSAQYYAAQWMAHGDAQSLPVPKKSTFKDHTTFVERYALTVFYFSTGGDYWSFDLKFLSGEHICTWNQEFKVIRDDYDLFDSDYITMGVHGCKWVDDELVPYSIFIPNNNLAGTIPNEIKELSRIEMMVLQFNGGLTGELPFGFSQMSKLNHLALQWCSLYGNIPIWIGDMKNLTYLGLGNNNFHGPITTQLKQLTQLELLGLDDNDLEADISIFSDLHNLKSLYLEDNEITGTISASLMSSWPELQEFDVSDNSLVGSLPSTIFNFNNKLEVVDLHGNQFTGTIPSETVTNLMLEFLALHENQFTGGVPESLANLRALKHLDISNNALENPMPEKLGEMTTLEYLFTGQNAWTAGEMPLFLIELTNLRELGMKEHHITGSIPDFIRYLSNLEFLDLHNNELTGTVPSKIGVLTNLKHLLLNSNQLHGTLPKEMEDLTKLQVLLLEHNDISGTANMICDKHSPEDDGNNNEDYFNDLEYFIADCAGAGAGAVECSCCTSCCDSADDAPCIVGDWEANLDPIWEYGYQRFRYSYDLGYRFIDIEPKQQNGREDKRKSNEGGGGGL